ncbi:MAG TPA: hypothetical protein VNT30_18140 [Stellaceae bacterium]|nr:hypothetical protein [Stellaceae bacterium]
MIRRIALLGAFLGLLSGLLPMAPASLGRAADAAVNAIVPDADASLTLCRDWLLFRTCKSYGHVTLPPVVTTGERVLLTYGSDTKSYRFPVLRIVRTGAQCLIYGETGDTVDQLDHLVVPACHPAS